MLEGQLNGMRGHVSELERENGRLEGERRELERQRDELQVQGGKCEAVEQDLGHMLQLIQDGIGSGTLRVSATRTSCCSHQLWWNSCTDKLHLSTHHFPSY